MFTFKVLDPRNIPAAIEASEKIFSSGPVYGIEVTIPALAKRCTFNLDPQHTGGNANRAAIEDALVAELPADGSILATVRADLDAVGAMVVFGLRKHNVVGIIPDDPYQAYCPRCQWDHDGLCDDILADVRMIAESDKFARGGWPGPRPLDFSSSSDEVDSRLAAIAAAVMDFKVPLADRVATMERWLLTGEEPKQYRDSVEKERADLVNALKAGQIKYETRSGGKIAVVESTHRAATSIGYRLAPVVVALNPNFKQSPGEPYRKFTVCAFEAKFADIKSALAELATLEAGWGGSPTIGGSPQGMPSTLTVDQVVAVVEKHLL